MSKRRKYVSKTQRETREINNSQTMTTDAPLSEQEVYDVLKFAGEAYKYAYNNSVKFDMFQGTYTPYLTNERLSEIGLSPLNLDSNQLKNVFQNPVSNQEELIGYSEYIKFTDMIAKRTLGYLGNLPAFNYTFTCTNINDPSEYTSEEYKTDLAVVKDFLSKFDVQGQFSAINRRTFEIDSYYSVFRMDGDRYEFQELPYNYCKITGKNLSWGYQFDFDMNWFLKMGLSFDQYPAIFKKMFENVMKGKNLEDYNPSNQLNERSGTFALWSQTSSLPNKGNFACFKMNSDMVASMPFLTPMFQDSVNKPLIRQLQNDQYIIASQKIMIGLIPILKEQKSGQIKDALAVSPETMGKFLGLLKQGLSNAIKITGAPFFDVKQVEFELPAKNMYNEYSSTLAANSGVTSRVVYASDRMSAAEVSLSSQIDEIISTQVYPQYERWLSSQINCFTKKYKFNFKFEGTKLKESRQERLETAMKVADRGLVMPAKFAAALGMNIFEMKELIQQSKYDGFQDLLYLLPNANTKDLGGDAGGRPKTDHPADSTDRNLDRQG